MCGIWALFETDPLHQSLMQTCIENCMRINHRGPDATRIETDERIKNCALGFHRLAIVDGLHGMQPTKLIQFPDLVSLCNGEIYNFKRLGEQFNFKYETKCDVECIQHLYKHHGIEAVVKNLDGVFAFILIDIENFKVFIARDPYGVRPLFRLTDDRGILAVCSEAKGLIGLGGTTTTGGFRRIEPFPPGTFEEYELQKNGGARLLQSKTFQIPGGRPTFLPFIPYDSLTSNIYANIRTLFTAAIKKRLMSDRRIGCFLSGGLDSSIVTALVVRLAKEAGIKYPIQTFTVGMPGSPDVEAADKLSRILGTEHHVINFRDEDVQDVLDEVIYTLETPDITTIRASICMYLGSRYVAASTDTAVLFSGEGADELCQGYIYFRDAPSAREAHEESLRLLREIYLFDGLRADRTTAGNRLELRVPFLDLQFANYYLGLPAELRAPQAGVEKHLLRKAFEGEGLLPEWALWRTKEAFSDGVTAPSRTLLEVVKGVVDARMPELFDAEAARRRYAHCPPRCKESLYYRKVFEKTFGGYAELFVPHFWMPKWVKGVTDPSARFIEHYNAVELPKKKE